MRIVNEMLKGITKGLDQFGSTVGILIMMWLFNINRQPPFTFEQLSMMVIAGIGMDAVRRLYIIQKSLYALREETARRGISSVMNEISLKLSQLVSKENETY